MVAYREMHFGPQGIFLMEYHKWQPGQIGNKAELQNHFQLSYYIQERESVILVSFPSKN